MRPAQKTMALWLIIVVIAVLFFQTYEQRTQTMIKQFDNIAFRKALSEGKIEKVVINRATGEISGEETGTEQEAGSV